MKKTNKLVAMLLMLMMLLSLLPAAALANAQHITHGKEISNATGLSDLFTSGGSGYLTQDIEVTQALTLTENLDLCLNGKKVTLKENVNISVKDGGVFSLYDCGTSVRDGYINANGLWTEGTPASGETVVKLTGGVITGGESSDGGAVAVGEGGTFNLYGGNLAGNKATGEYGGAVYVSGGTQDNPATFNMYGGSIIGNTAPHNGGGVELYEIWGRQINDNIVFNMTGGEIRYNTALGNCADIYKGYGGGVSNDLCTMKMTGGVISSNTCKPSQEGGGGGINNDGKLTLGGTAFVSGNFKVKGEAKTNDNVANGNGLVSIAVDDPQPGMKVGLTETEYKKLTEEQQPFFFVSGAAEEPVLPTPVEPTPEDPDPLAQIKADAIAAIKAAAGEDDSFAINQIVATAEKKINAATSEGAILILKSEALDQISKQLPTNSFFDALFGVPGSNGLLGFFGSIFQAKGVGDQSTNSLLEGIFSLVLPLIDWFIQFIKGNIPA